jgi:excisionase family DNA binding protein
VKLYTTVQAAKTLGVARDTLYRWMRDGKIRRPKITREGVFQSPLWTEQDLEWMRKIMKMNPHRNLGKKRKPKR